MLRALTIALTAVVFSASAEADDRNVYRWTDAEGNVHYSDRPQSDAAEETGITSKATDPTRVASATGKRLPSSADVPEADAAGDAGPEGEASDEDPADRAARFAENCRRAQSALSSIVNARRLYLPTDDGSRRYLDKDETAARRAKAQSDVQEWCG